MKQLDAFLDKNPLVRKNVFGFMSELKNIQQKYNQMKCDLDRLDSTLISIKRELMENVTDKAAAGCKNFKI